MTESIDVTKWFGKTIKAIVLDKPFAKHEVEVGDPNNALRIESSDSHDWKLLRTCRT